MKRFVSLCVSVPLWLAPLGCNSSSSPPAAVSGPASADGWEIRYTAAMSLARRGSDKLKDPVVQDIYLEMLDEQQQLRNARRNINGKEITDLAGASGTVYGALDSLAECHRLNKTADLSPFKAAIDKLTASSNPSIAKKAKSVREALGA